MSPNPNPQLSPAGSTTYDSNVVGLHVGDGTWDSSRDSFLLPNLMGLPFDAMRYNGMGNRFRELTDYHKIILVHGIFAAITFLFVVPAAIFVARFYHRNGRLALRLHIYLQITTVFLATVVLILGWFAVGPARSLTNPHHGIGIAIYTLIMFQTLFGWGIHHFEKGKERTRLPVVLVLHQWLGRTIALLAIAQVALGLTLYGSPKVLFILYAVWIFILILAYFILEYRNEPYYPMYDQTSVYASTDYTRPQSSYHPDRSHHDGGGVGKVVAAGGIGALLGGLLGRKRSERKAESEGRTSRSHSRTGRSRSHSRTRTDFQSSRRGGSRPPTSSSYISDDKYRPAKPEPKHGLKDKLLAAGAVGGVLAMAKGLFGGKKNARDDDAYSDTTSYYHRAPLGGHHSVAGTDAQRLEEGRVPTSPGTSYHGGAPAAVPVSAASPAGRARARSRRSGDSLTSWDDSYTSASPPRTPQKSHTVRNGIATLGVLGFIKHKMGAGKRQKEDDRIAALREKDRENERIARMNSQRRKYTGDGSPRKASRRHSMTTMTESEMGPLGGSTPALSRHHLPRPGPIASGAIPPPSLSAPSGLGLNPPPPLNTGSTPGVSSGSEAYQSSSGGRHHRHGSHGLAEAAAVGAGAAGVGALASRQRRAGDRRRLQDIPPPSSLPPPSDNGSQGVDPVAVRVNLHGSGNHVTLQRLSPAQAAMEREKRRRAGRDRSDSDLGQSGTEHWRRVEARERAEANALAGGAGASAAPSSVAGSQQPRPTYQAYSLPNASEEQHNIPAGPPLSGPSSSYPPPPPQAPTSQYHPSALSISTLPGPPPGAPPPLTSQTVPPAQQQQQQQGPYATNPPYASTLSTLPPPPPMPGAASASIMSGGPSPYESSAAGSRADSNRRRRRAERARRELAGREGRGTGGPSVEFT